MEECMKFTILMMTIGSLGDSKRFVNWKSKIYRMYQLFVQGSAIVFTIGVTVEMYVLRNDTENALEMIGWIITHIILCFKMYVFIFKKDKVDYIIETLPKNFVIRGERITIMNKDLIATVISSGTRVVMIYAFIMNFSFILYVDISPLINYLTSDHEAIANLTQTRELPVRLWLPYDDTKSPMFEITYVYLAVCAHTEGWIVCGIDVFCMTAIIFTTGQFQHLCDALKNLTKNVNRSLESEDETEAHNTVLYMNEARNNKLIVTEALQPNECTSPQDAEVYLKECIKHHQNL
ncbi:hypothetical protein L9F63_008988, partial [Diploptera punctata]